MSSAPQKILVIRFSSIGDMVLTTPVLRCLKQIAGSNISLHFLTKKKFSGVLQHNPYIDRFHLLDDSLWKIIGELRAEKFDFVVDLHHNQRSSLVRLLLGRPSAAFPKLNIQKWLLTKWGIDRLPRVHIVSRYMKAAMPLGIEDDGKGLDYFIPETARRWPASLPRDINGRYIAFVTGAGHATKRLTDEKIAEVCQSIQRPVVLLGGQEEAEAGERIARASGNNVYNLCGQLSLDGSAWMLQQAGVVIAHDTGLMHIAAALGKPLVSIWGNTVPEFGMYPYMPDQPHKHIIIGVDGLSCRPCSKIGYPQCPKKHFDCMNRITALQICQAVARLENSV